MTIEDASPQGGNAEAGAASQADASQNDHQQHEGDQADQAGGTNADAEAGEGGEQKPKPEKTAEERENARLRRRVDNLTKRLYQTQGAAPAQQQEQHSDEQDDEPVTMTRAELQHHIAEQAKQLAPSMTQQRAEAERRTAVLTTLAKDWGEDKFNTLASDLDDAFGGIADRSGKPKPATDAIFESENPKGIIEYLADPDNADEAERISNMSSSQAARAITRLEDKLKADKANAKPKPSNAAQPLEPARGGGGGSTSNMPDPSNTKAYIAWANAQEQRSR